MKAFLSNLFVRIRLVLIGIGHWPILEPVLEVLRYQRTAILAAGFVGMRIVPQWLPDLTADQLFVVQLLIMAVALIFFVGLQKEVLKEAEADLATLPTSDAGYLDEFTQLLLKAFQDAGKANNFLPIPPTG